MLETLSEIFSPIFTHSPILMVALPLLCAPICVLAKNRAWTITFVCVLACNILTFLLLVKGGGRYELGGWRAYHGIEYKIDGLNIIFIFLINFSAFALMPFAKRMVAKEIDEKKVPIFYGLFLLCFAGLLGIVCTNDIFNIYVFLEISSLATYALISAGKDRRALHSAFSYLIIGTIGATFILIAIGLIYISTGTLNIDDIAVKMTGNNSILLKAAIAFLTIGILMKIALFPLHIWLVNAYAYAPSFTSAFIAAVAGKISLYILLRFMSSVFVFGEVFNAGMGNLLLVLLSLCAIFVGTLCAIYENNIKRMLGFSTVAQIGFIMLIVGLAGKDQLFTILILIINHSFAKALLFASAGAIYFASNNTYIHSMAGLSKKMPLVCFGFLIGGFSIIGVPLTAGFISKWHLLSVLFGEYGMLFAIPVVVASFLSLLYIWKPLNIIYFSEISEENKQIKNVPLTIKISIVILILVNIYFGIFPSLNNGGANGP